MASKKKAVQKRSRAGEVAVQARHARIDFSNKGTSGPEVQEPEELKGEEGQEAPSSLTPIVVFEQPGDYVVGEYYGTRGDIGPNKSRLYDLKLTEKQLLTLGADKTTGIGGTSIKGGMIVSVWGATTLDTMMEQTPKNPGDRLLIQYTGETATKREQNPAKLFRVKVYPKAT